MILTGIHACKENSITGQAEKKMLSRYVGWKEDTGKLEEKKFIL